LCRSREEFLLSFFSFFFFRSSRHCPEVAEGQELLFPPAASQNPRFVRRNPADFASPASRSPAPRTDRSRCSSKMANAASGMAVNDDCKLRFLELKAKRTYRFVIYKIDEKLKQVVVDKLGEPTLGYEDFTASLPENECRYAIYDFDFVTEENCQKSKIFFIAWSPDTARVRSKMLYASSKDRFRRELDGIQVELQATDATEIGIDVIRGRAN
ncbi:hypothetical protein Taro_007097, partial [Colocasia esculenta]|nr:hypothetical protein [Colocasia esculenta]